MDERKMGTVQTQFAELVWKHEPIGSGELVKLCEKEWGWKKPTTYTVLRKLCERGIFKMKTAWSPRGSHGRNTTPRRANGWWTMHLTARCPPLLRPSPRARRFRRRRSPRCGR